MDNELFIEKCKQIVKKEIKDAVADPSGAYPNFNVFVVWSCKTLQNNKAILSASIKGAPLYEVTHNGDKGEIYIDTYVKESNQCIKA